MDNKAVSTITCSDDSVPGKFFKLIKKKFNKIRKVTSTAMMNHVVLTESLKKQLEFFAEKNIKIF